MNSFHDYQVTGYEVDGELGEVRLNLAWLYPGEANARPREQAVFSGVEDYFFEHDLGVNIVFAIEEVPLLGFLQSWEPHFQESAKWGWPRCWRGNVAATMNELSSKRARCYELSASHGLSGWVIAAGTRARLRG